MRFERKKLKLFVWLTIPLFFLTLFLIFPNSVFAKELAPHKIYGHLLLEGEIVTDLNSYQIDIHLERAGAPYTLAQYQGDPLYDDYYVVDIPIDDAVEEGIGAPGDRVDLVINGFVMLENIELHSGLITQWDISLCTYTQLELAIEGVEDGEDYQEDIVPIIRSKGCGVNVSATLNGEKFTPGTVINKSNHYTLIAYAQDSSGESEELQIDFTRSSVQADELNGEFTSDFSGWTLEGNTSFISLTDEIIMGSDGYAAMIDPPGASEFTIMHSDPIYVLGGSIVDLSLYLYGKAQDEVLLQVVSFSDHMMNNPVPLLDFDKLFPTADDQWQKVSTQLIIPENQYFIAIALSRNHATSATSALMIDDLSLTPISSIASTVPDDMGNLWIVVEDGARNFVAGVDNDLGLFDDAALSTVCNLPASTYGMKALKLNQAQITRDVYLTAGTYTFSFLVWSDQARDFIVEIGTIQHTVSAQPQVTRQEITYTVEEEGWCSLTFDQQADTDVYLSRIQLEEGDEATAYTPSARSNGYVSFSFNEEQELDFTKQGVLSFVFSSKHQGEDFFLVGGPGWSIEYRALDEGIVFSMQDFPDLCVVTPGQGGLLADETYRVVLSWDEDTIFFDLYDQSLSQPIDSDQSNAYNKNMVCDTLFVGSYLTGINQSKASNCMIRDIYYETMCPDECRCLYTVQHSLSIPSLATLQTMSEPTQATLILNHVPSVPSLESPAHMSEVATVFPTLSLYNSLDTDDDTLSYEFEIYPNTDLTPPAIASVSGLSEGDTITSWTCGIQLSNSAWYSWQARSFDGISYSDWMVGTSFFVNQPNFPPPIPTIHSPLDQAEVVDLQPTLVIINSIDPDGDSLTYEFAVYDDQTLTNLIASEVIAETQDTTSWTVPVVLEDNTWYYWHTRADDGENLSDWASGGFFVNTANDPPTVPIFINPENGAWVETYTPHLELASAVDLDNDSLNYLFEVYTDSSLNDLVIQDISSTPEWTLTISLNNHAWYYWRAQVVDEHGLAGGWMEAVSFVVNYGGVDDPPEINIVEPITDISVPPSSVLIRWDDQDPDSNADIALYYDTDNAGKNGVLIISGLKEDPDGENDSYLWDISNLAAGTYHVYAVITDAESSFTNYGPLSRTTQYPKIILIMGLIVMIVTLM